MPKQSLRMKGPSNLKIAYVEPRQLAPFAPPCGHHAIDLVSVAFRRLEARMPCQYDLHRGLPGPHCPTKIFKQVIKSRWPDGAPFGIWFLNFLLWTVPGRMRRDEPGCPALGFGGPGF